MTPRISRSQIGKAAAHPVFTGAVEQALSGFLTAFDNLDWPAFRACFAEDEVTIFHPGAPNLKRIDRPEAFEEAWLGVFARIKKQSGRDAPPYMNLQPKDLRIQILGPEIALATFHLIDGRILCRRSILMKQSSGVWKIVHVHASNLPSEMA
jgi:ketosteroid isomerase-like protein